MSLMVFLTKQLEKRQFHNLLGFVPISHSFYEAKIKLNNICILYLELKYVVFIYIPYTDYLACPNTWLETFTQIDDGTNRSFPWIDCFEGDVIMYVNSSICIEPMERSLLSLMEHWKKK